MLRFVVVAFLGGAAIGIVIGYALGRLHHRREGPPKPVQVRIERAQAAEAQGEGRARGRFASRVMGITHNGRYP